MMRILLVTTRPPWPPADGGRVVTANTIEALQQLGHDVTVVAPCYEPVPSVPSYSISEKTHLIAASRTGLGRMMARSLVGREPIAIARHRQHAVSERVRQLVTVHGVDVVHVEQIQALPQARPALEAGLPVVLRAQNVESDLWRQLAAVSRPWGPLLTLEASRLARWEGAAVRCVTATAALTEDDASALRTLAGDGSRIEVIPAPMSPEQPITGNRLKGQPALVLSSGAWLPNRDGARWFINDLWPAVRRAFPSAVLHIFGDRSQNGPGIASHPAPVDSADLFAPNAIVLVPLRIASGVRVRILEAWARAIPVIATPEAIRGLPESSAGVRDGGVRVASTAEEFVDAINEFSRADDVARLVAQGRRLLMAHHSPTSIARQFSQLYASVLGARA